MNKFNFLVTIKHKSEDLAEMIHDELHFKNCIAKLIKDEKYKFVIANEQVIDERLNNYETLQNRVEELEEEVKDLDKTIDKIHNARCNALSKNKELIEMLYKLISTLEIIRAQYSLSKSQIKELEDAKQLIQQVKEG